MEWVTLYIAGKAGFKDEVQRKLQESGLPYMPGTPENDSLCLFWMDDRTTLRDFKKAIGSKIVFKYRLQFFPSLEKYYESIRKKRQVPFTDQEQALIRTMYSWETSKSLRNSA